jgi:hypothetical protein
MKTAKPKKQTSAQVLLGIHLQELGLAPIAEYRFCERMWRFDLVDLTVRLAFEISGGNWTGGHSRGASQEQEYCKINRAQMMGFKVMQFTNRQVCSGEAKSFVAQYLK